jgi:hypothetical protein
MTVINVNDTALHSATRSPLWRRILSRIGRGVAAGLAAAVLLGPGSSSPHWRSRG